jgi:uncharacterized membrane protein
MTNIEGLTNRLGTHVEPVLLPISLLYLVWSDPRLLLLLQTVVIALGAWPVYLLARLALSRPPPAGGEDVPRQTGDEPAGQKLAYCLLPPLFAFAYLMFPALQSANQFDFHAVALAPTLFLFALYFIETERWGQFAILALLTMWCKEDMALVVFMLGLYALVVRRQWRIGPATMVVAGAWFLLAVGWILPHFDTRGVSPVATRYAYLGDGPGEMLSTVLTRPGVVLQQLITAEKGIYVFNMLAPVAFVALLAPQVLILAVPTLAVNLLSTDGFMHQLEGFHYGVMLAPIVVVAAAYGAAWLVRRWPRSRMSPSLLAAAILVATLWYHRSHGYTPLAVQFKGTWPAISAHHRLGEEMARQIPVEASLAALPRLNPHASQRQQLTMIDRVEDGLPAPLHDAEYVWLDVTNSWPLHPNDLRAAVDNLLAGEYGIEQAVDGWLLLRRGALEKTLPWGFYDFARVDSAGPQYPMKLQFLLDGEAALESLGFDLDDGPEGTELAIYWRALQPVPADLRLHPFYFDDGTGQILEDTSLRPMIATVWYPPADWQRDEIVATRMLPWDGALDYSVGLGAFRGDRWEVPNSRLSLHVESSDLVVRLFDGNTWARLLQVQGGKPVEELRSFSAPQPQHPLDADLDGSVRLLGYDQHRDRQGQLSLTLYWQAQERMETGYVVFAQLIGPAGAVRAQVDMVPQGGGYPTSWWLPEEVVADPLVLALPQDTAPGVAFRLIVGLYDPASGERLVDVGTGADHVELSTIEP